MQDIFQRQLQYRDADILDAGKFTYGADSRPSDVPSRNYKRSKLRNVSYYNMGIETSRKEVEGKPMAQKPRNNVRGFCCTPMLANRLKIQPFSHVIP